ncbi:MAG: glycosyltransferase [Thermoguttaceae bacterium]
MKQFCPPTWIVVPCYNEAKRLSVTAFAEFGSGQRDIGLLFVDDGSRDNTAEVLANLCQTSPDLLHTISLERNGGKAEAVRQGMLHIFNSGNAMPRYVGYWDADLATPLEAIPEFVATLDSDPTLILVLGARLLLLGRHIERRWIRHILGRCFATAASNLLTLPVYDTQCGAKLFRVCPAVEQLFAEKFQTRWIFDVEILARMLTQQDAESRRALQNRLYELPLLKWCDVAGSKLKYSDFVRAVFEYATIYWHYFGPWKQSVPIPEEMYRVHTITDTPRRRAA